MKLKITLLLAMFSTCAFAQNVRYDAPFPSVSSTTATPFLVANTPPNSPVLSVCKSPANGLPCTNYTATFTSAGALCPNGAQDTPQPQPSACQPTGDAQGNIGFWAPAGQYDYTVCIQNNCFGPYTVTLGGSGGGGGSGTPNQKISFTSSNSVAFATSFTTPNLVWECYDTASPANTVYPSNVTVSSGSVVTFTFAVPQSGFCIVNGSGGGSGGGGGSATPGGSANSLQTNQGLSFGGIAPVAPGSVLASQGTLISPAFQTKPVIDVRDYGVKGDGTTDDTTAMQNAINAACPTASLGGYIGLPANTPFHIKITSTLNFTKCWGVHFNGGQGTGEANGAVVSGASIVWAGVAGGTVMLLNQTRDSLFENFSIITQSASGQNNANIGIDIDEQSTVTTITTNNLFRNISVRSQDANSNLALIRLGETAPGNVERQVFEHLTLNCSNGNPSFSNSGSAVLLSPNGMAQTNRLIFHDINVANCSSAITLTPGGSADIVDIDTGDFSNNYTDLTTGISDNHVTYRNIRSETCVNPIVVGASNTNSLVLDNLSFSGCTGILFTLPANGGRRLTMTHIRSDNSPAAAFSISTSNTTYSIYADDVVWPSGFTVSPTFFSQFPNGAFIYRSFSGANSWPLINTIGWSLVSAAPNVVNFNSDGQSPLVGWSTAQWNGSTIEADAFKAGSVAFNIGGNTSSGLSFVYTPGTSSPNSIAAYGFDKPFSGLNTIAVSTPQTPTIGHIGTGGSTSYSYAITALGSFGNSAGSAVGTSAASNATLSGGNCNTITWLPQHGGNGTAGIWGYAVYRTASGGTPASTGQIATVSALSLSNKNSDSYSFNDCGSAGDAASLPATNTSGGINVVGQINSTISTGTAPLVIASTTVVPNLNVSQLLGGTWASPGAIGSTTPNTGAFTSLLASGTLDGQAPVTITSGASATLGGTYNSGYTLNQEATAATAVTYTLPTAAPGKQYCIKNSYNGSAADTGILTLQTSATGQFIIYNGTQGASHGTLVSNGAAGDAACVVGISSTQWEAYSQVGSWTVH